jgi:hypothetical protein
MALRVTNTQRFLWLTFVGIISYWFILFNAKPIVRKKILILPNSSIYNEFLQLQIPFLRLVIRILLRI